MSIILKHKLEKDTKLGFLLKIKQKKYGKLLI